MARSSAKNRVKIPSVRFPKINFSLKRFLEDSKSYTPILLVLLIIFSFLLGAMTTQLASTGSLGKSIPTDLQTDTGTPGQPAPGEKVDVEVGSLPVLGNENAPVTLIEFSDFQCPFCKQWFDQTKDQLIKEYVDTGKVKFAYRQYPIPQLHPNAQKASEASECANDQDKFWEYHDLLFTQQDSWASLADPSGQFSTYAGNLGMNTSSFDSCLSSGKYADKVSEDVQAGTAAGVSGTPTFFINGTPLVGAQPYDSFKTLIDQELSK